jgi:exopolyphosphatase/guanosine-5'-triphosphate,3'-diphosphate pyrophosphatase
MRLGQRLSGGVAGPLTASGLTLSPQAVTLRLPAGEGALYGEAVERRHRALSAAFGRKAEVVEG